LHGQLGIISISACAAGECPEKKVALYIVLISCFDVTCGFVPKRKVEKENNQ
jgi:hypothetical protein